MAGKEKENNQSPQLRKLTYFGKALREFRENYWERVVKPKDPTVPYFRITALALIASMEEHGYSISSGAESEIETNISIPKDPMQFIKSATVGLGLTNEDQDYLARCVAFSDLSKKMGEEGARIALEEDLEGLTRIHLERERQKEERRAAGQNKPTQP